MINSLTSLRFIFALMVFFSHLSFLKTEEGSISNWIFKYIFSEGALGVSFFFVLSGFILSHRYKNKFVHNKQSKRLFYIGRISRIFPLHVICLIISIPLVIHLYNGSIINLVSKGVLNLSLIQSFIPLKSVYFSFNAPSWSLSDELFFYLLFPFLITVIYPIKIRKNIIITLTVTAFLTLLLFIIPQKFRHQLFYVNPIFRLYDFIMGILLYRFYEYIKSKQIKSGTRFELISIASFFILFLFHNQAPAFIINSLYYMIPICLIILSISLERGKISYYLRNKIFINLGEISFAFYMFHQLVIRYYLKLTLHPLLYNYFFDSILILLISITISYLSFSLFENKANHLLKSKLTTLHKTLFNNNSNT